MQAQLSLQPEQDCFQAIPLCQEQFTQTTSYIGAGLNTEEVNPDISSCGTTTGEVNSVWYTFRIDTGGDLCFTLSPTTATDDYDWSLYNLTNSTCSEIFTQASLEIACNKEAPNLAAGCNGGTGADGDTLLPCGTDNALCIPVLAGQVFVLNVGFISGADNGYTLDFSSSTASILDNTSPDLIAASSGCSEISVSFSESILCATVDPNDFTLDGPGGPYAITDIQSDNCGAGGTYDRAFRLSFAPDIPEAGSYTLSVVGSLTDLCGNDANLTSLPVALEPLPTVSIETADGLCLNGNEFNLELGGNSTNLVDIAWDLGDGTLRSSRTFSHSYQRAGDKTIILAVRDDRGCTDTTQRTVTVFPHPEVDFTLPGSVCEGDSTLFVSEARIDTPYTLLGYNWELGGVSVGSDSAVQVVPATTGSISVSHTVIGTNDCPTTVQKSYLVYAPPEVAFDISGALCLDQPIDFRDRSSTQDNNGGGALSPADLAWNFGDGATAVGTPTPTHFFASPGTYPVTLSAVTNFGCRDSLTRLVNIQETSPPQLFPDSVCVGQTVQIEALPPEEAFTYWYENPNDTEPVFINDLIRIDDIQRDTTFYVEAVSFEGCPSERLPITAFAIERANLDLSISDTTLVFPFTGVFFGINGFASLASVSWDFGDGNTSDDPRPFHIYNADGLFEMTLDITDEFGCTYSFSQQIEVAKPVTAFIPTAFSPNGDGINDELFMRSQLLERFLIQIFDRYGNEVFRSFDPEFRWDGAYQGTLVQEGVYSFRFRAIDITGLLIEDQGTITVIK